MEGQNKGERERDEGQVDQNVTWREVKGGRLR